MHLLQFVLVLTYLFILEIKKLHLFIKMRSFCATVYWHRVIQYTVIAGLLSQSPRRSVSQQPSGSPTCYVITAILTAPPL